MALSAAQALGIAQKDLAQSPVHQDPLYAPWSNASLEQPILVSTVFKQPSYWLVPVMIKKHAVGFVRVLMTGAVAAIGVLYRDASQIGACPSTVTWLTSTDARVQAQTQLQPGETLSEPIYVHDGPPGHEAWLVIVRREGRPQRWLFIGPGGFYERPAGQMRDTSLE
jgi:hypothetical protein